MSRLDDYNKKNKESWERLMKSDKIRPLIVRWFNPITEKRESIKRSEFQKRQFARFCEIENYFQSEECNWAEMPSYHSDKKFVNHLRRYCQTLRNLQITTNDKSALELIAESKIELNWKTIFAFKRSINTSWIEADLTYEQYGKLFRAVTYRILQDVFIKSELKSNAVNFSELESDKSDSEFDYHSRTGSFSISNLGKHNCHLCGKPAIPDTNVCYNCNIK